MPKSLPLRRRGSFRARGEALECRQMLSVDAAASPLPEITTTNSDQPIYLPHDYVHEDVKGGDENPAELNQSNLVINMDDYRADPRFAGIDGGGYSVVILDTGIDLNHPHFGPDANGNGISDRIVYSWDFADNDSNASDVDGHGSNVAGIAASSNATYTGMAPGANIIALKVFTNSGGGNFSYIEQALQWVVANRTTYNIAAVNMSLGDGGNWTNTAVRYGIGDEMATLAANNVIVVSAAGNDFWEWSSAQGVSYPASDANSLAIGATYDANIGNNVNWGGPIDFTTGVDRIVSFSQRHATLTDVFAPGSEIRAANATGGTSNISGTSQASPHIAGIAVVAQDLAMTRIGRRLTFAEFRSLLQSTGVTINDGDDENDNVTNTGLNFKRVDMMALANAIWAMGTGGSNNAPTLNPIGNKVVNETALLTFTASATDPDAGQTLSYSLGAGAPAGMSINPTSGVFTWTPADSLASPLSVTVIVTDNGAPAGNDSETIQITVNNLPPTSVLSSDYTIDEGSSLSLIGSGSDPAGAADPLTFSWDINGDGVFGDATGTTPFVTWEQLNALGITNGPFTTNNLRLRVNDGDGGITDSVARTFTVNNVAPVAAVAFTSFVTTEGNALVLSASATDANPTETLTFSWDLNGDSVFGDAVGNNPTVTWSQLVGLGLGDGLTIVGNAAVRVTDDAASDDQLFTVIIVNVAPTADAGGPYTITQGDDLPLNGSGSDPSASDPLTFSWDLNGDNTFGDAVGATPVVTAAELASLGLGVGVHTNVRVRANDGDGGETTSAPTTLTIEALAVDAPRIGGVSIAGSGSVHAVYDVPTGSGEQLRTIPIGNLDRISISFDSDVVIGQGDLSVTGVNVANYPVSSFSYDSVNFIATWTLGQVVGDDELTIHLPDTIVSAVGGLALDGGYTNPTSLTDPTGGSFPSGDGLAGGAFDFRVNVLPGDANRDNIVSGADYTIWADGFDAFPGNATFADGDFNGDGFVSGADYTIWADNFGVDQTAPPAPFTPGRVTGTTVGDADTPVLAPAAKVLSSRLDATVSTSATTAATRLTAVRRAADRVFGDDGSLDTVLTRVAPRFTARHA